MVVLTLLLGFFGPWAQVSSCSRPPGPTAPEYTIYTGASWTIDNPRLLVPLLAPVLVFLILTILSLGPETWQRWRFFSRLERVFAIVSLASMGSLSFLVAWLPASIGTLSIISDWLPPRIVWGFLVELAGVVTGLLNVFAESMTLPTTATNARLWRYVFGVFALLGLLGWLALVLLQFQ